MWLWLWVSAAGGCGACAEEDAFPAVLVLVDCCCGCGGEFTSSVVSNACEKVVGRNDSIGFTGRGGGMLEAAAVLLLLRVDAVGCCCRRLGVLVALVCPVDAADGGFFAYGLEMGFIFSSIQCSCVE